MGIGFFIDDMRLKTARFAGRVKAKTLQLGLKMAMGGGAAMVATKFSAPFRQSLNLAPISGTASAALTTGDVIASAATGLASVGIGTGMYVYLNHLEHQHCQKRLCELYRPQIASILGIERDAVGVDHLKEVAAENPTLQAELSRKKTSRNIKNFGALVGTVVAFTAVLAAIALFPPLGALAAAASAGGLFSGAGIALAVTAGAIGYASMQSARHAVCKMGKSLFGLNKPSAEDKIQELSKAHRREKTITPVQVLGVYATALPELASEIKTQFGKPFDKLRPQEQYAAAQQFGPALDLTDVTTAINEGHMNVRELTFRVHGQNSGVYPEPSRKEWLMDKAQEGVDIAQDKFGHLWEEAQDKMQDWREHRKESKQQDKVAEALEKGRDLPGASEEKSPSRWRKLVSRRRESEGQELVGRA